jgi:hypothetical protein
MHRMLSLWTVGALCAVPQALAGQAAALPTAAAVHARYVEALGGREALARQMFRRAVGRVELPAQGITGAIEIAAAAPDRMRTRVEIPGLGEILQGFDGTTSWIVNPAAGPMVQSGRALDQARQMADFHFLLHPERWVDSMEIVGAAEFGGRAVYELRIVLKTGEEYTEYYDRENGLLAGTRRMQSNPMGDLPTTSFVDDYREFGGVKTPMRARVQAMGLEQVITLDSVSHAPIPDSVFALPPAIQALVRP